MSKLDELVALTRERNKAYLEAVRAMSAAEEAFQGAEKIRSDAWADLRQAEAAVLEFIRRSIESAHSAEVPHK